MSTDQDHKSEMEEATANLSTVRDTPSGMEESSAGAQAPELNDMRFTGVDEYFPEALTSTDSVSEDEDEDEDEESQDSEMSEIIVNTKFSSPMKQNVADMDDGSEVSDESAAEFTEASLQLDLQRDMEIYSPWRDDPRLLGIPTSCS